MISDAILFVFPLRGSHAKMRARVTRDGTIYAQNSTFGCFDGANPTLLLEKVSSYGLLPRIWLLICSKTYCTIRHYLLCLLIISTSEPRAPMQNGLSFTYTPLLWGRCFLLTLMTGARSRLLVIGSCWRWIILQSMSACHWLKVKQDHLCLLEVESQITVRWPGAWKDD